MDIGTICLLVFLCALSLNIGMIAGWLISKGARTKKDTHNDPRN